VTVIIGIDPGLKGAICVHRGPDNIEVFDMPTVSLIVNGKARNMVDPYQFRDIIINAGPCNMVVLEKLSTRPGESPIAALSYGIGFGQMIGVLVALERPYTTVTPQEWTKVLRVGADKDLHRLVAMQNFPHAADLFKRKKDDGRADAALIAHWASRHE
jgi:crossover junction endodeoxyribonuclease RuvC